MKVGIAKVLVLTLVAGLTAFASANTAYGQARPSSKTQVVSVDPLGLAYNFPVTIQYEMKASPVNSWAFRAHYWPSRVAGIDWSAFGAGAAYRVFIADSRALTGLSVAPAADILFFRGTTIAKENVSGIVGWIGGDIAYKWIFDQFSLEPLLGLRIGFGGNSTYGIPYATGMVPILSVMGGYAW
jgi:hypothetical protein